MRTIALLTGCLMLLSPLASAPCLAASEDLDITGNVRLRLRYVDSGATDSLFGTYGEFLRRGFSQRHRLILEAVYPLAGAVRVGGLVRVSNEDEEVLSSGPEYLASEFGSAFIAYETPGATARFGYYSLAYTPLTLMRWDIKDDPEGGGGGCAVCGGPGVAGAILGETLEELGPNLTFEGLKVRFAPHEVLGLDGYLARPSISGETYAVVTYGGRATFKQYWRHAGSFLDLSMHVVRSEDDRKLLEDDDEDPLGPIFYNTVYGFSWSVPIQHRTSFTGEWSVTESEGQDLSAVFLPPWHIEGKGGIFSLSADFRKNLNIEASYVYLSPNWDSYFRALSYSANREGLRARVEYGGDRLLVALFARYLQPVDPEDVGTGPETGSVDAYPTYSARGYFRPAPSLNLGLATIYSAELVDEDSGGYDLDSSRLTLLGTVTYEFTKDSSVSVEERYVRNKPGGAREDYDVSMLSLYVTAKIW
jgi:hypothetical protein